MMELPHTWQENQMRISSNPEIQQITDRLTRQSAKMGGHGFERITMKKD